MGRCDIAGEYRRGLHGTSSRAGREPHHRPPAAHGRLRGCALVLALLLAARMHAPA